jgi:hypothetical protein
MAALVRPDVEWRPSEAGGRALHGTEDLQRYSCSHEIVMPTLRMFHGRGEDVLVEAEYESDDGSVRTVWLLYRYVLTAPPARLPLVPVGVSRSPSACFC